MKEKALCFKKNGIYAYTSHVIAGKAFITVEVAVENQEKVEKDVWIDIHMHQLIDTAKEEIAEEPGIKAAGDIKLMVPAEGCAVARTTICVEDAVLWTMKKPILYVVEAVLYQAVAEGEALPNPKLLAGMALTKPHAMKMLDFEETRFGIRTVSVDTRFGLSINGESVRLNGKDLRQESLVCENFDEVYAEMKALQGEGYNALLVKELLPEHYYDACNRLGILLLCDVTDVEAILATRSFPAVCAWMSDKVSADEIRALDTLRPVSGICDGTYGKIGDSIDKLLWLDETEIVCAKWDMVGYTAETPFAKETAILFPNRPIFFVGALTDGDKEKFLAGKNVVGTFQ